MPRLAYPDGASGAWIGRSRGEKGPPEAIPGTGPSPQRPSRKAAGRRLAAPASPEGRRGLLTWRARRRELGPGPSAAFPPAAASAADSPQPAPPGSAPFLREGGVCDARFRFRGAIGGGRGERPREWERRLRGHAPSRDGRAHAQGEKASAPRHVGSLAPLVDVSVSCSEKV